MFSSDPGTFLINHYLTTLDLTVGLGSGHFFMCHLLLPLFPLPI